MWSVQIEAINFVSILMDFQNILGRSFIGQLSFRFNGVVCGYLLRS